MIETRKYQTLKNIYKKIPSNNKQKSKKYQTLMNENRIPKK